ncbi:uncharacterized protein LOC121418834 [Lytechinus variegatus]|uniref:uncharacterized protein LOC121418834 n=1 Tax=Lytechinus variegatus TaxID=7654 RepID=UPI001BB1E835|nr:uncharacterized protein LOC121418834 [Lytechinus variegatus]
MEKHVIFALVVLVLAIVVPSMILAAPTFLDTILDPDRDDGVDQAFDPPALQPLHDTDVSPFNSNDQGYGLSQHLRDRRTSRLSNKQCMNTCWFCISTFRKDIIQLGECLAGCTNKRLTNPLETQAWSKCAKYSHF